jgi:hypothetical protein
MGLHWVLLHLFSAKAFSGLSFLFSLYHSGVALILWIQIPLSS